MQILVETNALSFQIAMWALKNKYIWNQHVSQIKSSSNFSQQNLKKLINHSSEESNQRYATKMNSSDEVEKVKKYEKNKIYVRTNFKMKSKTSLE